MFVLGLLFSICDQVTSALILQLESASSMDAVII